jgi:hypothetical protein
MLPIFSPFLRIGYLEKTAEFRGLRDIPNAKTGPVYADFLEKSSTINKKDIVFTFGISRASNKYCVVGCASMKHTLFIFDGSRGPGENKKKPLTV